MTDAAVQIILKARNETQKVLKQAQGELKKYDEEARKNSDTMRRRFTISTQLARAGIVGLGTTLAVVASQMWRFERAAEEGGNSIAAMARMTEEGAAVIREEIRTLFGNNANGIEDSISAIRTLETAFKVFDITDREGLAQLLVDWKDATGQNIDEAGSNFRRIVLTYFGPDADISTVLPGVADKLFAVAAAVGLDPGGFARAFADAAPELRTAFPTMDEAIAFLAALGAAGGNPGAAAQAVRAFAKALTEARESIGKGEFTGPALDAFAVLGLTPETIGNEGFDLGELMMTALKNGMADGVLTPAELDALGVLFSSEVAGDMALAGGAIEGFVGDAQTALTDFEGAVNHAADVANSGFGPRMTQNWNTFISNVTATNPWQAMQDIIVETLGYLGNLVNFDLTGMAESGFSIGENLLRLMGLGDQADAAVAFKAWWDNEVVPAWQTFVAEVREGDWSGAENAAMDLYRLFGLWTAEDVREWWNGSVVPAWNAFWSGHPAGQIGADIWNGISTAWHDATSGALAFYTDLWQNVIKPALMGEMKLSEVGPELWARMRDAWTEAINGTEGVIPWAVNRWRTFREAFTAWSNNTVTVGGELWESFILGLEQTWSDVTGWVGRKWTDLRAEFDVWKTNMTTVGSDLMAGFTEGMNAGWDAITGPTSDSVNGFIEFWRDLLGIQSPSKVFMEIGAQVMDGFRSGLDDGARANLDSARAFISDLRAMYEKNAENLKGLFTGTYKPMWNDMLTDGLSALEQLGVGVSDATKGMLGTWAGYADQFMGLLDKHNGNVLRAFADLLLGIAQQKLLELAVVNAVEIGKAWVEAPGTFGASLAKLGPITAAYAAGAAAISALRSQIVGSFAIGSDYVPASGLAMVHEGEAVLNRTEAQAYRAGSTNGGGDVTVQVILDGQLITEQVSRRLYGGVRQFVKADLRYAR